VILLAALAPAGLRFRFATVLLGPLGLALAHAALAGTSRGAPGGAVALAGLGVAVAVASAGLAALGRRLGCPAAVAGGIAAAVLGVASGGVWWADRLAERVDLERRGEVRQAVLRIDPLLAAAYAASGYDRLRSPAVYEGTTVASSAVTPPTAADTACLWAATGLALAGLAVLGPRRARRGVGEVP